MLIKETGISPFGSHIGLIGIRVLISARIQILMVELSSLGCVDKYTLTWNPFVDHPFLISLNQEQLSKSEESKTPISIKNKLY